VAPSIIARLLRRAGPYWPAELGPVRPINRYEYAWPGQLLHLDIRKLARLQRPGHRVTGDRQITSKGSGWEYVHLVIDDHSRVVFGSIEPNERVISYLSSQQCARALQRWLYHYNWHRVCISLDDKPPWHRVCISLDDKPPMSRTSLNNVVGVHT